jgi:hypothetical protein
VISESMAVPRLDIQGANHEHRWHPTFPRILALEDGASVCSRLGFLDDFCTLGGAVQRL